MEFSIAIDGQFGHMTGVQYYVDSLLHGLYALPTDHQITAFTTAVTSSEVWNDVTRDGLFAWRESPRVRIDVAGGGFQWPALPAAAQKRLLHALKTRTSVWRGRRASRRYDVMHFPSPATPAYATYRAKHAIITIHDLTTITCSWAHRPHEIDEWARMFEFARRRCERILAVSEYTKQDIVERLHIPADRIDVTPLAARSSTRRVEDREEIRRVLAEYGLPDTPFLLYAGTLEPRKNLKRLIQAFAHVVQSGRLSEHKLVLAGGSWDNYDVDLHAEAMAQGLSGRVITTGYVSNSFMNVMMSACEAFAYVSEYEGFGLPPLEAMTCGAPVIASRTTSLPEVVGEAGIQVAPDDTEEIAAAIHRLLTDCGENKRRRALSLARAPLFSWERTAQLTLKSYEAAAA